MGQGCVGRAAVYQRDAPPPCEARSAVCIYGVSNIGGSMVLALPRTEKCQFDTEKCQFDTEKCQFCREAEEGPHGLLIKPVAGWSLTYGIWARRDVESGAAPVH